MQFSARLTQLRRASGLTQKTLASVAEVHVNQICRYEAGSAQPTLDALVRLAKALRVSLDGLVFGEGGRGPEDEFRFYFEALAQLDARERIVVKEVLDCILLKHQLAHFQRNEMRIAVL